MLQAFADTRGILQFTTVVLASNLALTMCLTSALGLSGAAVATLLSAGLGWWLYLRRIGQHLGVGLGRVMPWRV
jgi:O-antigen/teichoic acid export membrane protein